MTGLKFTLISKVENVLLHLGMGWVRAQLGDGHAADFGQITSKNSRNLERDWFTDLCQWGD